MPDPITLFKLCPTCGGSGQIPDDRFPGDAMIACTRPCTACKQARVVGISFAEFRRLRERPGDVVEDGKGS